MHRLTTRVLSWWLAMALILSGAWAWWPAQGETSPATAAQVLRMYANIRKHARAGERVLVLGGQGHVAILRDLLELDADRQAVDIREYL